MNLGRGEARLKGRASDMMDLSDLSRFMDGGFIHVCEIDIVIRLTDFFFVPTRTMNCKSDLSLRSQQPASAGRP